jgi:hypothetical protein
MKPRWTISWERMLQLGRLWLELWDLEDAGANEHGQWFHRGMQTGLQPWPDVLRDLVDGCESV